MTLSQKETDLLKDMKGQEQLCIDKYEKYASQACSESLKTLFHSLADVERQHLTSVTDLLGGKVPTVGGSGSSGLDRSDTGKASYTDESSKKNDAFLCSDTSGS